MQSRNRSKYTIGGHLAKFMLSHPEFDAQQFAEYAKAQKGMIKKTVDAETRLALLGFKAAGILEKSGYRQGLASENPLPIVVWRVKTQ